MKPVPEQYSVEVVKYLTDLHILRFTNRIVVKKNSPDSPYGKATNLAECERYLALWKSIEEKKYEWLKLDSTEKNEVMEALDDEELPPAA